MRPTPIYFDPENIVELAVEGGCNAVATTFGVLGHGVPPVRPQDPVHRQDQPQRAADLPHHLSTRSCSASVDQAFDLGAAGVGATIYFGSEESTRQIQEVSEAFARAHELGMFTVLWCYLRNSAFKKDGVDYHGVADLTGQANHIGVTIEADIIKQKQPEQQRRLHGHRLRQDPPARSTPS